MNDPNELARELKAFEQVDTNRFQRQARILQAIWRAEQGYPIGQHRGREIGSYLAMPWAQDTLANFLDETIRKVVREDVLEGDDSDGRLIDKNRLFSNLLSSQPLAFNLFAHMREDLHLATKVFSQLTSGRCEKVIAIEFEYSPGRGNPKYTGDRSAFDVFVIFADCNERSGFVGIEVKYHENLTNKASNHKLRYDGVAEQMGCFKADRLEQLRDKPLQQIWRDHLLAGSLLAADEYEDGMFVFLSPAGNTACNEAILAYRQCLISDRSFDHWTLESVVDALRSATSEPWIELLYDRYLNFPKVEARIL